LEFQASPDSPLTVVDTDIFSALATRIVVGEMRPLGDNPIETTTKAALTVAIVKFAQLVAVSQGPADGTDRRVVVVPYDPLLRSASDP